MLQYLFVHGWGNEPGFWQKTLPYFLDCDVHCVDLEFIKASGKRIDSPLRFESRKIYVTYSLGTLWTLKNRSKDIDALIVINGFFNFKPFADEQVLQTMKERLESDPIPQMGAFWRQCGISPDNKDLNLKRLQEGMNWLIHENTAGELHSANFPVLSLAAKDGPILPVDTMRHHWSGYLLSPVMSHCIAQYTATGEENEYFDLFSGRCNYIGTIVDAVSLVAQHSITL